MHSFFTAAAELFWSLLGLQVIILLLHPLQLLLCFLPCWPSWPQPCCDDVASIREVSGVPLLYMAAGVALAEVLMDLMRNVQEAASSRVSTIAEFIAV